MGFDPINHRIKTIKHHIPWLVWLVLILVLSLTPGDKLPDIEWELFSISTLAHFGMYFGLTSLLLYGFLQKRSSKDEKKLNLSNWRLYLIMILIGTGVGYGIELIQEKFIYQRYYDTEDIVVNGIGTVFGALGYTLIGRKLV